jgi:tRNA pseudouridine55 synthase
VTPGPEVTGLVIVDKAAGWTSHDVVARLRGVYGLRRVGHAGTLDPDATGVLVVGLGRATRLLRFLGALVKCYEAEIVLGVVTDTLDASGRVTGTWDMGAVTVAEARAAAAALSGPIEQVPPMVSAVKIGGRRLHQLARAGIEVERPARPVEVYRFDLEPTDEAGVLRASVACSAGTYVRVLAADLGARLGGGAHLRALRRTQVGTFGLEDAHSLDELRALDDPRRVVLDPAEAVRDLAPLHATPAVALRARTGASFAREELGALGEGPWALIDDDGTLLGVYEPTGPDRVRPAERRSARRPRRRTRGPRLTFGGWRSSARGTARRSPADRR